MAGRGRGRGRGRELTRPAWMTTESVAPSLPKPVAPSHLELSSTASEWATATSATGRIYWYSRTTGATTWNDPTKPSASAAAPPAVTPIVDEWKEHRTAQGRPYYYNPSTGETRWERPSAPAAVPRKVEEVAPLPPGWAKSTAADGREYYYHATTRETRWTRPGTDSTPSAPPPTADTTVSGKRKAEEPAPLPAGWTMYRTPDGRPYYFHAQSSRTSWSHPAAAADAKPAGAPSAREQQGPAKRPRIGGQDAQRKPGGRNVRRPRDEEGNPMRNRAAEKWFLERAQKRRAAEAAVEGGTENGEGMDGAEKVAHDDGDEKSLPKFERKQRFQKMLAECGVTVKSTMLQAMDLCANDPRYEGLEIYGERKSSFHSFLQKQQSEQRREGILNGIQANEQFMEFLKQELKNEPMYRRALEDCHPDRVKRVRESAAYRAVTSDATRHGIVRAFFDLRKRAHERERAEKRRRMMQKARALLDAMTDPSIRPRPPESMGAEQGQVTVELLKDLDINKELGPPWLNTRTSIREADRRLTGFSYFRDLNPKDIQIIFGDWIRDVDRMEDEKRIREKEARKSLQRATRAKFRSGVLAMLLDGRVSFRAQWRDVAPDIGQEEFAAPENELGERPVNLFKDAKEMFESRVHKHKDKFKDLLKEADLNVTDETTQEELSKVEKISEFFSALEKPIITALIFERQRKEQRRREHAYADFEGLLRDLLRHDELALDTTYEAASAVLAGKDRMEHLIAVVGPDSAKSAYEKFMERRRIKEERRSKRRMDDHAGGSSAEKRPRLDGRNGIPAIDALPHSRDDDTGWAAALSAKPLTESQKAEEKERKKRALLATLGTNKAARTSSPRFLPAPSAATVPQGPKTTSVLTPASTSAGTLPAGGTPRSHEVVKTETGIPSAGATPLHVHKQEAPLASENGPIADGALVPEGASVPKSKTELKNAEGSEATPAS